MVFAINSSSAPNLALLNLVNELSVKSFGLTAIAIIGLLSVIRSTADSYLSTTGLSFIHDVLVPCKILSDQNKLYAVRLITLIFVIIATLSRFYFEKIFVLTIYFSNFWVPIVGGRLLLRLLKNNNQ